MKVWDSLRRIFGAKDTLPPVLRNRPGGMAWIKGLDGSGCEALNGRAVRTVCMHDAMWVIEPPQHWVCTHNTMWVSTGLFTPAGTCIVTTGIADQHLEPWKDIDDGSDESLWVPAPREVLALPVREMSGGAR
jgi:hypothetical protein